MIFNIWKYLLTVLEFYLFFRNEFNTFNNTGARMLDSIYHMALSQLNIMAFMAWKCQDLANFTQR